VQGTGIAKQIEKLLVHVLGDDDVWLLKLGSLDEDPHKYSRRAFRAAPVEFLPWPMFG
jgi:hypothetical protein